MRIWAGFIAAAVLALATGPAAALSLIRDAEIEATLERIAHPVFRALATAERFTLEGRFADANRNAARAAALLPEGSPGWRKAEDLSRLTRRATRRGKP